MSDKFILIGQTPVPCDDLLEWARWFETEDRHVLVTPILNTCRVSTVFLGLDHNLLRIVNPDLPPILFETMAFWDGDGGYEQERCATWEEAEAQHARMCAEVVRPAAVLAWICRGWVNYWQKARDDWRRSWRELRGIPASEMEEITERLEEGLQTTLSKWWDA